MIYFIKMSDACLTLLGVFFFIRELLNIVFIIVPIGLIIMVMVDFVKNIISFNEDSKKILALAFRRIIYTMVLFLIPTIVFGGLNAIGAINKDSESCWNYVGERSTDDVRKIVKDMEEAQKKESEEINARLADKMNQEKDTINNIKYTIISKSSNNTTSNNDGSITLDWNDLTKTSNLSSSTDLADALNKTKNLKAFAPYATSLFEAEQKYKVNVFFLIGLEAHESGIMTSSAAKDCNNLGGVKGSPKCSGHKYRKFNSKNDFIEYHAKLLGDEYLKKGGKFYHGKKIENIVKTYCGDCPDWIKDTKTFANQVYNKVK